LAELSSHSVDLSGRRFGKLVVNMFVRGDGATNFWRCVCDCGKKLTLSSHYLLGGKKMACDRGCRFGDMVGRTFGRLTVAARARTPAGRHGRFWLCQCSCGRAVVKPTRALPVDRSCGCIQKLPGDLAARNAVISTYRGTARRRGYAFALTVAQCDRLMRCNCHYCGRQPSQKRRVNSSVFVFNGLDRKNSKLGYTIRNVVPCCKLCNQRKSSTPYKEFVGWLMMAAAVVGQHVSKRNHPKLAALARKERMTGGRRFQPAA
jgi:hypothetical protein